MCRPISFNHYHRKGRAVLIQMSIRPHHCSSLLTHTLQDKPLTGHEELTEIYSCCWTLRTPHWGVEGFQDRELYLFVVCKGGFGNSYYLCRLRGVNHNVNCSKNITERWIRQTWINECRNTMRCFHTEDFWIVWQLCKWGDSYRAALVHLQHATNLSDPDKLEWGPLRDIKKNYYNYIEIT